MKAAGSDITITLSKDEGTTGNFEITYNGQLLFSKQEEKEFPSDDALAKVLNQLAPGSSSSNKWRLSKDALGELNFSDAQLESLTGRGFQHAEGLRRWMAVHGIADSATQQKLLATVG